MRTSESYYQSTVQYERNAVSQSLKDSILKAISEAQIEAWNEAIELAHDWSLDPVFKEKILKLKKP